jgi:hypothetical protein
LATASAGLESEPRTALNVSDDDVSGAGFTETSLGVREPSTLAVAVTHGRQGATN